MVWFAVSEKLCNSGNPNWLMKIKISGKMQKRCFDDVSMTLVQK